MDQIAYSLWFHQDWRLYAVLSAAPMFIAGILMVVSQIRRSIGTRVLRRAVRMGPRPSRE